MDYYAKSSTLINDEEIPVKSESIAEKLDSIEKSLFETSQVLINIIQKIDNVPSPDNVRKEAECMHDKLNSIGSLSNECMSMAHVLEHTIFG